jgi:hypothetical protein
MASSQFAATVHRISVDSDGEAKLVLTIPLTDAHKVLPLAGAQESLMVTITQGE